MSASPSVHRQDEAFSMDFNSVLAVVRVVGLDEVLIVDFGDKQQTFHCQSSWRRQCMCAVVDVPCVYRVVTSLHLESS